MLTLFGIVLRTTIGPVRGVNPHVIAPLPSGFYRLRCVTLSLWHKTSMSQGVVEERR